MGTLNLIVKQGKARLVGASNVEMLGQSLEAVDIDMTAEEADALIRV